jgi:hypothetical protein
LCDENAITMGRTRQPEAAMNPETRREFARCDRERERPFWGPRGLCKES